MTRLADTHCHLYMKGLSHRLDEVFRNASGAGVERYMLVSSDEQSSFEVVSMLGRFSEKGVYGAVGVHPHDSKSVAEGLPEELTDLAGNERVLAVGETGLDYYYDHSPRDIQKKVFSMHIGFAREAGKPLIIHARDSYNDVLSLLEKEKAHECGGVIHCFSGTTADAARALKLGFYISFAGPVTYPRNGGLRKAAAVIPEDRILCETDSPFLAPQPVRGATNEPAMVRHVYEAVAAARGVPLEELAPKIWRNASDLFGWPD